MRFRPMPNLTKFVLALASLAAGNAAPIPAGTELVIRLDDSVSSKHSQAGDHVCGVLVQSVPPNAGIPLGSVFEGTVTAALGKGVHDSRAELAIRFDSITSGDFVLPISTRISGVDNARETVDDSGTIHGVRPMKSRPGKLETALMFAAYAHPVSLVSYNLAKLVFIKARRRPSINFEPGTEVRLEVEAPFDLPLAMQADTVTASSVYPSLRALIAQQPLRTTTDKSEPSDLTNLLITGNAEQVANAFEDAGWNSADPLCFISKAKMFIAMIRRKAYANGPVSPMLLGSRPPDMVFQKQLNTFAKRHHIRLWLMPETFEGSQVWLASATHDIGIRFAPWVNTINHKVDSDLDAEREKVVADLQFLGRVTNLAYVERPRAPQSLENATGDHMVTDGQMAFLALR
ncbi:MAG: LssY C-terminal domain-containing protein [Acidobacteriota bacterium]